MCHKWFEDIPMERLIKKKVKPPFKPSFSGEKSLVISQSNLSMSK